LVLLARDVPNVENRAYEISVSKYILTTDRPTSHLEHLEWRYLRNFILSTPCFVLGTVFGVGVLNGAISVSIKSKMAAIRLKQDLFRRGR